jgi:hypothetical protein
MPLIQSKSPKAFKSNIKAEIASGKPQKQAVAIAYAVKRKAGKADGGGVNQPDLIKDLQAYAAKISRPGPGREALMARDKAASEQRLKEDTSGFADLMLKQKAMKSKYEGLGGSRYQMADRDQNLSPAEREARGMEGEMGKLSSRIQAVKQSKPRNPTDRDPLQGRIGLNVAYKTPRKGQTNLRNIPVMNLPGASEYAKSAAEKDRADRPSRIKSAIKENLGKHRTPNLPKAKGGKVKKSCW